MTVKHIKYLKYLLPDLYDISSKLNGALYVSCMTRKLLLLNDKRLNKGYANFHFGGEFWGCGQTETLITPDEKNIIHSVSNLKDFYDIGVYMDWQYQAREKRESGFFFKLRYHTVYSLRLLPSHTAFFTHFLMSLMDCEQSLTSLNLMRSGRKLICLEGWYVLMQN